MHLVSDRRGAPVWWKITVPAAVDAHLDFSADFSPGYVLYRQNGSGFDGLERLVRESLQQHGHTRDHSEELYFRLEPATTYYVATDGNGAPGDGRPLPAATSRSSCRRPQPPPNDDFADAEVLTGTADAARWTTHRATAEPGEPSRPRAPHRVVRVRRRRSSGEYLFDFCGDDEDGFPLTDLADTEVYAQDGAGFDGSASGARAPTDLSCDGNFEDEPMRYQFTRGRRQDVLHPARRPRCRRGPARSRASAS